MIIILLDVLSQNQKLPLDYFLRCIEITSICADMYANVKQSFMFIAQNELLLDIKSTEHVLAEL